MENKNKLANESSVYLLQHANNPVNWYPWGEEALQKAKEESKPLIVSIGYSACHWCHVMEHESFEDDEVAELMNKYFVCIKVDREERPDIDQVYMDAVQLMAGSGGWPLNCFALPDGRPFWGGTYFQKEKWKQILTEVHSVFTKEFKKVEELANKLKSGIEQNNIINIPKDNKEFDVKFVDEMVTTWSAIFDNEEGGSINPPKFPLPNNYTYLLRYAHLAQNKEVLVHVNLTLKKMAYGGIYDHLGGGFARYSTDILWKAPHFEKMLYDNAQMVSLYSEAFQATKNPLYKKIVYETLKFVKRELTSEEGAFYSSLDADSEGEEGKYYVWEKEKIEELLNDDFELFSKYYNINSKGLWEHGNYILLRDEDNEKIAAKHGITTEQLEISINKSKEKLLIERDKRIKPGLDDSSLTSWNALMVKAYADAYSVFKEADFITAAIKNANLILEKLLKNEGELFHTYKNGKAKINAFLDDYSFTIEAFIKLYEVTFDNKWLQKAEELLKYTLQHFHDKKTGMFFYTPDSSQVIVSRKIELFDNVVPSSNSSLAISLFLIGRHTTNRDYTDITQNMLNNVKDSILKYGSSFSNWGNLLLKTTYPFYEVVITGENAISLSNDISDHYIPNKVQAGTEEEISNAIPLLQHRFIVGKDLIYVCKDGVCELPVEDISEALSLIR